MAPAADKDIIFLHLMRNVELFEQARMAGLSWTDFQPIKTRHYSYLWRAACEYFDAHRKLIPRLILEREVERLLEGEDMVTDQQRKKTLDLLTFVYSIDDKELAADYVRDHLLQPLLDEVKVAPKLRELATETDSQQLTKMFAESQELYHQTRVVVNRSADMFSESGRHRHTEGQQPVPTGIDFIDYAVIGLRPGSMVGCMAESSGGKTMLGTQFLCEQAVGNNVTLGFFYEQSLEGDIAERFYSYLTGASRDDLRGKTYKDYPENAKRHLDGLERQLSQYLLIYDMSGAVAGQGNGGPDEIEAIVGNLKRRGINVKSMVIDWLLPMVTRYHKMTKEVRTSDKREKVDLVLTRLKEISERYDVTIVLLHQIAPHIIESKTPHYKPDWTVSAECKGFGFLMDYVFVFGRKCEVTNCMWFNVPKARGASKTARVVMMDAAHNKIVDARGFELNAAAERDGKYFTQKRRERGIPAAGTV